MIIKSDNGIIDDIVSEENYLSNDTDGFYNVYVREAVGSGFGRPTNITVRNNVFERGATPISTGSTIADQTKFVRTEANRTDPTWIVWSGNKWNDGIEVVPPGG